MNTSVFASRTHSFILSLTIAGLAACSSTVDLAQPSLKESSVPTCTVKPGDYKLLAYWNDRTEDKNYGKIIAALERKYVAAPLVGSTSAVVAAQTYVRQNGSVEPLEIEKKVQEYCRSRT